MYGSCPLEQAADQICSRSFGPRAASSAGITVEVSAVNGSPSRNHDVSFVVRASTMRRLLSGSGRVRTDSTNEETSAMPICRAIGSSRASTRYSLPGWSTIALSLWTSARTQSKLVAVRVIGIPRTSVAAVRAAATPDEVPVDGLGDAVERQDLVGEAGLADRAGHAPDDGAGLVLDHDGAAGGADLAGAVAAVGAHAGEDDGQDGAVVGGHDRAEERVDGRAAEVLRRALVQRGVRAARAAADHQVVVAGGEVDGAGQQRRAVDGLDDAQRAEPVEALGELAGEDRRHVLDEEDRHGEGGRQLRQDLGQRLGAAGGGADHQDGGLLAGAGARGRGARGRDRRSGAGRAGGRPGGR